MCGVMMEPDRDFLNASSYESDGRAVHTTVTWLPGSPRKNSPSTEGSMPLSVSPSSKRMKWPAESGADRISSEKAYLPKALATWLITSPFTAEQIIGMGVE